LLSEAGRLEIQASQRRSIEQLLHDEEAKLKKYDDDNKKESPGSGKTA
jgi:hypothetical protein